MTTDTIINLVANILLLPFLAWIIGRFKAARAKVESNGKKIEALVEAVKRAKDHRERIEGEIDDLRTSMDDLLNRVTKMEVKISVFWHDISQDAARILLDTRKGE